MRAARIEEAVARARSTPGAASSLVVLEDAMGHVRRLEAHERFGLRGVHGGAQHLRALVEGERTACAHRNPAAKAGSPEGAEAGPRGKVGGLAPAARGGPERRAERREEVRLFTRLQPGGVHALVEDLSSRGLFLRSPWTRTIGSRVRLMLDSPFGPVHLEGLVRWVRGGRAGCDETLSGGMGIQFPAPRPELLRRLVRAGEGGMAQRIAL